MNADSIGSGRDSHPLWSGEVIPCPQCGQEIPDFAVACPHCGSCITTIRSGYCPQCRAVASATAADTCEECGAEMIDVKVERSPTANQPAPAAEDRTKFDVILKEPGRQTVDVIKLVSALTGLGLEEAMDLVEDAPRPVKHAVDEAEAKDIKKRLEEVGATAEINAATPAPRDPLEPAAQGTVTHAPAPASEVPLAAAKTETKATAQAQESSPTRTRERKPRSRRFWVLLASTGGAAAVAAAIAVGVLYGDANDEAGDGVAPGTAGTASPTVAADAAMATQGVQEKWKVKVGGQTSSLAIANGAVYLSSDDGYLYAVDTETGQERWKSSPASADYYPPVVADGMVCFGVEGNATGDDSYFCARDTATGEERWTFRPATGFSPLAGAHGAFYFGCDDGYLYALDTPTGEVKWRFGTRNAVVFGPSAADGVVYFGSSDGCLYAVDTETRRKKWQFQTGDVGSSSPRVSDGVVCYYSGDGYLYAVDAETGRKKWQIRPASAISNPPVISDGLVCYGCDNDRVLYAVDAETGQERWRFEAADRSPAIADGVVYVSGDDGCLCALDAETGQENWKFKPGASGVSSSPAIAAGVVYFASGDGYLYALPVPRVAKTVVKVGTVLSLTGPEHSIGEAFQADYTRIVGEAQQLGGILTHDSDQRLPIELVVLDDGSDAAQHLVELEKLMDVDQVDLILLPMPTARLEDVVALANEHEYGDMTGEPMALGLLTSERDLLDLLYSMFSDSP